MKKFMKSILPVRLWQLLRTIYFNKILATGYRLFGRKIVPGETTKARGRRLKESFFERYCSGKGLDIGFGGDLLADNCTGWDYEHGDAQYLQGVRDASYDFVYASHTLEHMVSVETSLQNWWRVVKPGGYLIIYIPDRDLYEKKTALPSRWNDDHKHFFLLDRDDPPDTVGIVPLIQRILPGQKIVYARICDEGHTISDPARHSDGEFSLEIVIRKNGSLPQDANGNR
jgi:SAM-dependent methyltransferase